MKEKQILFYCSEPVVMFNKLSLLLRKRGYKTSLFSMCEKEKANIEFYKGNFDDICLSNFQFSKPGLKAFFNILKRGWNLLAFLIRLKFRNPWAVIASGTNWEIKFLHKYFYKNYPFIYFPYDIMSNCWNSKEEAIKDGTRMFELRAEKYCFENADGILHKGDPDELKRLENYTFDPSKVTKSQLSFLSYCSNDLMVPINKEKLSKKDGKLHICFVGYIFPCSKDKINDIFGEFVKHKFHIHLYLTGLGYHLEAKKEKEYTEEFFAPLIKSPFFHLHNRVKPEMLAQEISRYDFGIFPFQFISVDIPDTQFCFPNKISSYLEAGLPVIYSRKHKFLHKVMKSYGLAFQYDERDMSKIRVSLEKCNYNKLIKNVELCRKDFNMENKFPNFENFLKETVEEKYKISH